MRDSAISVLLKGRNAIRLLEGLGVTLSLSAASVLLSILVGLVLGFLMMRKNRVIRLFCRIWLETIRIVPQLVLLFLVYFGAAKAFGLQISGEAAAIIVFTFWGGGEMGDLVRGALTSIPKHQSESALALGLTHQQVFLHVLLPQAVRRLIPQAINLATRMIKTTSLVMLIGVIEVTKVGQQIIDASRFEAPAAAIWIYAVVFFLYFIVCRPITMLASRLEKRFN